MKTSFLITILLLFTQSVLAQPNISKFEGELKHNSFITIKGNNFGSKANANPIRFDNFEDGVIGELVTTTGYWSNRPGASNYFNGDNSRSTRSGKNIKSHMFNYEIGPGPNGWFYKKNIGFQATGKAYVNFWVYCDFITGGATNDQGGDGKHQVKLWRVNHDGEHASKPNVRHEMLSLENENPKRSPYTYTEAQGASGNDFPNARLTGNYQPLDEHWLNITLEWKASSLDNRDGKYILNVTATPRTPDDPYQRLIVDNIMTRSTGYDRHIDALNLGYLSVDGAVEMETITYWDDVYIDNSWARVEIGDKKNYYDCSHREIQLITEWVEGTQDSITTRLNQGAFNGLSGNYLFVVNEEGVASEGFPLGESVRDFKEEN